MLPAGGLRRGTLVEWLGDAKGSGAATLAVMAAAEACRGGKSLVVVDHGGEFYPPAAVRLGVAPNRLIVVRITTNERQSKVDCAWAFDQALRCSGVGAVLAWPEKIDALEFRRWQLAVEKSGALGLLVRGASDRKEPSWADVRLLVEPFRRAESVVQSHAEICEYESVSRRLTIHVLRCRGGVDNRSVDVEIDNETCPMPPVSELGNSTHSCCATRA